MFWSFVGSWALNLMKLSWLLHIIRNLPLPLFVKCSTCFMPTFVPFFFWPAMGKASFSYQIKGKYMSARKKCFWLRVSESTSSSHFLETETWCFSLWEPNFLLYSICASYKTWASHLHAANIYKCSLRVFVPFFHELQVSRIKWSV